MMHSVDALPSPRRAADVPACDAALFGWHGIMLRPPEGWNLTRYHGGPRTGLLLFSTLRHHCMEVRWHGALRPRRRYESLLRSWRKAGARISPFTDSQAAIEHEGRRLLIAAGTRRVFELSLGESVDPGVDWASLLPGDLCAADAADQWRWSVYGACGEVPRRLPLRAATLLPGSATLEFSNRLHAGGRITLGSVSLALSRLQGRSLAAWAAAAMPWLQQAPGTWRQPDDDHAAFTATLPCTWPWRPQRRTLTLHHHRALNRIEWQLHLLEA